MRREELNMKEKELHVGICFPENLKIMVKGKKKKNLLKSKPEMLHKYITCSQLLKEEFVTRLIHD